MGEGDIALVGAILLGGAGAALGASEQLLHWIVISVVVITEASTYIYMAAIYERPKTTAEWAIIGLRGLTAPFLSVYLAMARPLPVTARDILAQSELAAGTGVIHDVTTIANNTDAPLADKMMLYDASAVMGERDRARLGKMIAVAQIVAANASSATSTTPYDTAFERLNTDRSNTFSAPVRTPEPTAAGEDHHEGDEPPENDPNPPRGKRPASLDNTRGEVYRSNVRKVASNTGDSAASVASVAYARTPKSKPILKPVLKPKPRAPRADSGMSQDERDALRVAREEAGAKILAKDPDISVRAFARRVAVSTQHPIRESTAQGILGSLRGRLPRSRSAEAAEQAAQVMTNTN